MTAQLFDKYHLVVRDHVVLNPLRPLFLFNHHPHSYKVGGKGYSSLELGGPYPDVAAGNNRREDGRSGANYCIKRHKARGVTLS